MIGNPMGVENMSKRPIKPEPDRWSVVSIKDDQQESFQGIAQLQSIGDPLLTFFETS
jgi:hypothetical protein